MATIKFANNKGGRSVAGVTLVDASIQILDAASLPELTGDEYYYITLIHPTSGALEVVKVTAKAGDTITVSRAQDGTAALAFDTYCYFEMRLCAALLTDINVVPMLGVANGIALLDASAKIALASLPASLLTEAEASALYLTLASAAATYLTTANAAATYLTIANAAATYMLGADGTVTLAKMANLATDKVIGRATAGAGVPEAIDCKAAARAIMAAADNDAIRALLTLGTTENVTFGGVTLGGGLLLKKITISATDPVLADLVDGELRLVY